MVSFSQTTDLLTDNWTFTGESIETTQRNCCGVHRKLHRYHKGLFTWRSEKPRRWANPPGCGWKNSSRLAAILEPWDLGVRCCCACNEITWRQPQLGWSLTWQIATLIESVTLLSRASNPPLSHLSCKRDQGNVTNYRDRLVTLPTRDPSAPHKETLNGSLV